MKGRPTYLPNALGRIARLGEEAITEFINEIPPHQQKVIAKNLPSIAGFRTGTKSSVQRQLKSLAHRIAIQKTAKVFSRTKEETALYSLWRTWPQSQLEEPVIIQNLFKNLEEENEKQHQEAYRIEQVLVSIKALVATGTCAREKLERFITFSPFENVNEFIEVASIAPTKSDILKTSTLRGLPDRLNKDETRLELLETKLDATDRNTSLIRSDLDEVRQLIAELRTRIVELGSTADELKLTAGITLNSQKSIEETVARLTQSTERLAGQLKIFERQASEAEKNQQSLKNEVTLASLSLDRLSEQLLAEDKRLDQITVDFKAYESMLKSHNERLSQVETYGVRIDEMESMLLESYEAKSGNQPALEGLTENKDQRKNVGSSLEPTLLIESLTIESGLSAKPLHSVAEILALLDSTLIEAGLKKSLVTRFAEEILSAVASEQIVFFRGGTAVDIARKCALCLCGAAVFRVSIPVGLTDPSLLRQRLRGCSNYTSDNLSSIILEGVNNSPLDILREVLLDHVSNRVGSLGREAPTVIFATLVDGGGGFPLEPSYLELGPVFDLEQMDWRQWRREKLPVLGFVTRNFWGSIRGNWEAKTINYEEALEGVRQLSTKRNIRFEANVIRAFSVLKIIRRDQQFTALQSVSFGWLVPYWQSLDAKAEDIKTQIDDGKCDGTIADERLKRMLVEYREQATGVSK